MKTLLTGAAIAFALTATHHAGAATMTTLHNREHRQVRTLHADQGTVRFFRNHPALARTGPGRRALRFARAEISWTHRELAETQKTLELTLRAADPVGYRERYVCRVFGPSCQTALRVTHCEARRAWTQGHPETAVNGQYRGAWQMGSHERATYGDSPTFEGQTDAAHRYYVASHGFGPWSCY